MARLTWDNTGERLYETGVDRGVLYIPDGNGAYSDGVAWNGLTTVTESPSGAEATAEGTARGHTDLSSHDVSPGAHNVRGHPATSRFKENGSTLFQTYDIWRIFASG